VFDVTAAGLVTAIVTEKGIVMQPDKNKMKGLFLQK
jgi:methylthioribose-1-phosphate isomerase